MNRRYQGYNDRRKKVIRIVSRSASSNNVRIVCSNPETAIVSQFKKSMDADNKKRKELNIPIVRYDAIRRKAYLEYLDGRVVDYDEA